MSLTRNLGSGAYSVSLQPSLNLLPVKEYHLAARFVMRYRSCARELVRIALTKTGCSAKFVHSPHLFLVEACALWCGVTFFVHFFCSCELNFGLGRAPIG